MNELIIGRDEIKNIRGFHDAIAKLSDVPDYYGINLYALYDILTTYGRPLKLRWLNSESSKIYLGKDDFDSIINVLEKTVKYDINNNMRYGFSFSLE